MKRKLLLRFSRIKYKPPMCERLRSLGLCYENGVECPKHIRSPLEYREAKEGVKEANT